MQRVWHPRTYGSGPLGSGGLPEHSRPLSSKRLQAIHANE